MDTKIPEKCKNCENMDGKKGDEYCQMGIWDIGVNINPVIALVSDCQFFSPK